MKIVWVHRGARQDFCDCVGDVQDCVASVLNTVDVRLKIYMKIFRNRSERAMDKSKGVGAQL